MDAPRGEEPLDGVQPAGTVESRSRRTEEGALRRVLARAEPPLAYWQAPDGTAIAAQGDAMALAEPSWRSLQEQAEEAWDAIEYDGPPAGRPRMIGGARFDGRAHRDDLWRGFADRFFFLPRHQVVRRDGDTWYTATGESRDPDSPVAEPRTRIRTTDTRPIPARETWTASVDTMRERISEGAFEKVVLAHSLEAELSGAPSALECVDRLLETNPGAYISVTKPASDALFVAATPERLVRRRGSDIASGALAGTIGRGRTSEDDARLSESLRSDRKESHEHQLVVAAIRAALEGLGASVTVQDRRVRRLRSVQHLYTPVAASHPDDRHVLDLVDALHPTPAVGGWPPEPALAAIRDVEPFDRGWYAGPIGWFDAAGDGTFAIGIRSAVIRRAKARLFAGAGIVEGSDPAAEWEEIQWKYRPVLDALAER